MNPSIFKARYKEFIAVDDSDIIIQLEECSTLLNEKIYSNKYEIALFLLVAHELYLMQNINELGVIASRSIEGGSVSFKNLSKDQQELYYSKTNYGLKYLAIKKMVRFTGAVLCE